MKNVNDCKNLFELADYLNEYRKQNPEDDCLDIIQNACDNASAWTYTGDVEGYYYDDDYVTDGTHILYIREDGAFDTRLEEK